VANDAIGGITRIAVVGIGGRGVVIGMAIDAIVADAVKTQGCLRYVALIATCGGVGAYERKSIVLVQLRDIVYQPILRGMAASAIHAHGLVVDVGMAIDALGTCFGKDHRYMAALAIHRSVAAAKRKPGRIVIKLDGFVGNFPAVGRMTGCAIDLEIRSVRGLRKQSDRKSK